MAAKQPKTVSQRATDGMRGRPLRDFITRLKRQVEGCEADAENRRLATEKLDSIVKRIGYWKVNRRDMPSLPKMPRFHPLPGSGKSYSNIPIPAPCRHLFGNRMQHTKKWRGSGHAACGNAHRKMSRKCIENEATWL